MVEKQPRSQDLKSVHAMTSGFLFGEITLLLKILKRRDVQISVENFFSYGRRY